MTAFNPGAIATFRIGAWRYDVDSATLHLGYALDDLTFDEVITFDGAQGVRPPDWVARAFDLAHLLAGISYFKAACPDRIECENPPAPEIAAFCTRVYRHGLGEFAFRNGLQGLHERIVIPGAETRPISHGDADVDGVTDGIVVPMGGGKDSLVAADLLTRAGQPFRTIAVGQSRLITDVVAHLPCSHLRIQRRIDPRLLELNQRGALNGHVPITAILAAVMIAAGGLYGYNTVVMSNERSADEPNVVLDDGFEVNHQYSKSLAFERDFGAILRAFIHPDLSYFSLLRPWSELAITGHFSGLEPFHGHFSSCNRNFHLHGERAPSRWCRVCPKCRSVWLLLAAFLDPETMEEIFGGDLTREEGAEEGFAELLGLQGHKPFECVGEIRESRAALSACLARPAWRDHELLRRLGGQLKPEPLEPWLASAIDHCIPNQFLQASHALGRP